MLERRNSNVCSSVDYLTLALGIVALPTRSEPKTPGKTITTTAQDPGLSISTTQISLPNQNSVVWNLTGRYEKSGRALNLRATTVRPSVGWLINPRLQAPTAQPADAEPPYSSESEMSRSDGTVAVAAEYTHDENTAQDVLSVTLNGITITFNLNTEEFSPITDVQLEQLSTWLQSDEGRLVQETAAAIVQYGQQEPTNEALLNLLSNFNTGGL
jgi:hypothetical protein